ncbi:MAG: GNAT family N-acetyltransferase [Dissulfurimicrobium sp.]|uniref:GNAT family N-acetyltransferase n=1 Tax=Dissulfurimicrobium sp. TaxID=2022436 RepID=UPI00404A2958
MWIIRPAHEEDLPQILTIEKMSHPKPWSRKDFEAELDDHVSFSYFWVASPVDALSKVAGYICFRWLIDEVYIINLTVAPDIRRHGIGSRLMNNCIKWARMRKGKTVVLDVRRDNLSAIAFYEKMGFLMARKGGDMSAVSSQASLVMTLSIGG